jgi:penicillin-binding protein 1A
VIRAAVEGKPVVDFPVPAGVVSARIDPRSGLLAYEGMQDAVEEVFLEGTEPAEMATPPDVLDTSSFVMEQLGGLQPPGPDATPSEEKEREKAEESPHPVANP